MSCELRPELIIILTNGIVNIRTKPALNKLFEESFIELEILSKFILCIKKVIIHTKSKIPPGRYNPEKLAFIPISFKIFLNSNVKDNKSCIKSSLILD